MALLLDAHFWVGVALMVFLGILAWAGVHKFAWKALGDAGAKVQAQLDEANALRDEAQALLAQVKAQKDASERLATEILANAKEEATRLQAEQLERRSQMAERKIAQAEAQAEAEVRGAAAELAAQMAEQVLVARLSGAKSDPLVDRAIGQLAGKLQ